MRLFIGATLFLLTTAGLSHHAAVVSRNRFPVLEDLVYLPSANALRAVSLGHRELAADLIFLRTVVFFGSALVTTKNYSWLDQHLDTVVDLDPAFRSAYLFGSRATMYNGKEITRRSIESSNHFLEAGLKRFPNDWEFAFSLGCNYLFEMHSDDPHQKEVWRRIGGRWIRHAAISGGGPSWLPNLAAKLMSEEGQVEASIRYLEEAYLTAQDDAARTEIGNLLAAKRKSSIARLAQAGEDFRRSWKATLPYASPDLFAVVGPALSPRLDIAHLTRNAVLDADDEEARSDEEQDRR